MTALLFLALSWLTGFILLSRATGGISNWRSLLFNRSSISYEHSWLFTTLATAAAGLWTGLIISSWAVYLLALSADKLLSATSIIHPLLPANVIVMIAQLLFVIYHFYNRRISRYQPPLDWKNLLSSGKRLAKRSDKSFYISIFSALIFFLFFSCWLMLSSFSSNGGTVAAGYTVFSDFAPHTAMVSSFSAGRNWPTIYPHFAGDGIAYHFMFFFLCGNLNWLGLPIGLAINIPSILGMLSALILLGVLAVVLSRRSAAFLLTPILTLARSSMAFFTWFTDLFHEYNGGWRQIFTAMRFQRVFIGNTPHDDWGLWTVNVYANQRHLMPALAIMLLIILLFVPQLSSKPLKISIMSKHDWIGYNGSSDKGMILACILLALFAFWHGSVLIATLAVLAVMALFSRARIYYLTAAVLASAGALLQISFFTESDGNGISARFLWGFIAENKSMAGISSYLIELTGVLIPLALLQFLLRGRRRRIMLTASLLPLLIAFTLSLTPDVTVNHKFIMITQMLLNIWIADLLLNLWNGRDKLFLHLKTFFRKPGWLTAKRSLNLLLVRLTVCFLVFMLTVTGLSEWHIFANGNKGSYLIESDSEVNDWIKQETAPDSIFITAPWHYHGFFLTGRNVWLGHSYYAWSAGHDTGGRLIDLQQLLAGEWSAEEIYEYAAQNHIDYLLIDDDLRTHPQLTVNESFIAMNFTLKASFKDTGNTVIYDLSS